MTQPPPVTHWINQLKAGDSAAAEGLWEVYFRRMVNLARQRLEGASRTAADEEDVALSAFKSFCIGAKNGRFPRLLDSDNLWPLLMAITAHKSVDLIREQNRQKRGGSGRATAADEDQASARSQNIAAALSDIISREPTPEFAAELSENLQQLLCQLDETGDADLRRIALLKMDGYSNEEIGTQIGCVRRSVERKLQLIAKRWGKDMES